MRRRIFFLFLGLTLAGTTWAWGQPGQDFGGGGFQDRFQQVQRSQLGPALGVNQQTVDKLLQIDAQYRAKRRQLIMGEISDMQRLQQLLAQTAPPEKEIKAILADMKRKRLEIQNLQQRKDEEETALLTPLQQARYRVYLMSLIKQARNVKAGTWIPGGQGAHGNMVAPGGIAPAPVVGPGGMPVPTLRPSETPVSGPPQ